MKSETRMPRLAELAHEALQMIVPARRVEAALGGALLAPLRHDAGGVRPMPERDRQHLVGRRHLEIERQGEPVHQPADVGVGDVAAILAKMRGDAVGAGLLGDQRGAHRIGLGCRRARSARSRHGRC